MALPAEHEELSKLTVSAVELLPTLRCSAEIVREC